MIVLFFLITSTLGLALFIFGKDPRVVEIGKIMIFCSLLAICMRLTPGGPGGCTAAFDAVKV